MSKILFFLSILGTLLVCGCNGVTQENGESVIQGQETQTSTDLLARISGTWEADDCLNINARKKLNYDHASKTLIEEEVFYANIADCKYKSSPVFRFREEINGPFYFLFSYALGQRLKSKVFMYQNYSAENAGAFHRLYDTCDVRNLITNQWNNCEDKVHTEYQNGENVTIYAFDNLSSYEDSYNGIHFTQWGTEYTRVQ